MFPKKKKSRILAGFFGCWIKMEHSELNKLISSIDESLYSCVRSRLLKTDWNI